MYAKKSLGQHFILCRWVVATLVKTAGVTPQDLILEIGPGTGVLTRPLAQNSRKVVAVEKDERMALDLKKTLTKERIFNVEITEGDILKLPPLFQAKLETNYKIVANIPYYLTSRLLRIILESWPRPELVVLTVQKEVAQRIIARPPKMNLLAFSVQIYGKPEIIKTVPPECFYPKPKVESAIIKIVPHEETLPAETREKIFKTAKAIFSNRRKTVLNNLSQLLSKERAKMVLDEAKIPHHKRGGELSVNDIVSISKVVTL